MKMVSASPVSVCPWQTSAEVRCHLAIPPSKTPEMTVAVANLVSPVAAGKTEVALVGVPPIGGGAVVVAALLVVVGLVPPAVVVAALVVVTGDDPPV